MPAPETLRLFVAVELPGEVREALGRLQHELQRRGLEKLRWVRPEGIHLTLKFLGPTPAERVPAIEEALQQAVKGVPSFQITLDHVDTFRGERIPRVLWVGIGGTGTFHGGLVTLIQKVEQQMEGIGYTRETRGFSGHLTLARVRQGTGAEMAPKISEAVKSRDLWRPIMKDAVISVREISLMRSTLRSSGAVYERIAAFPLGGT